VGGKEVKGGKRENHSTLEQERNRYFTGDKKNTGLATSFAGGKTLARKDRPRTENRGKKVRSCRGATQSRSLKQKKRKKKKKIGGQGGLGPPWRGEKVELEKEKSRKPIRSEGTRLHKKKTGGERQGVLDSQWTSRAGGGGEWGRTSSGGLL